MNSELDTNSREENNHQSSMVHPGRLVIEHFLVCTAVAVVTAIITTLIWDSAKRAEGSIEIYNWSPIDDLPSILFLMPFGMLMYFLFPPGWIYLAGLICTLKSRRREFIALSAVGAVFFGIIWPKHCVAMLGI